MDSTFADSAEWHQVTAVPDRSTFRGLDEIRGFLQGLVDDFDLTTEMRSYIDAGDHVAAVGTIHGEATGGLRIELAFVHVWRLEDGKAVWVYDCAGTDRGP